MEVDAIVYANSLITMANGEREVQKRKAIAINDGKIIDIYDDDRESVWPMKKLKYDAKESYGTRHRCLVMPGMINTHGHGPMKYYRGAIPDGVPFRELLLEYILPMERNYIDPLAVSLDTSLAIFEMKEGGVTTSAEMYYHTKDMARVFRRHNMRGILGETIMSDGTYPFPSIEKAYRFLEEIAAESDDLVKFAIAPHAPHTVNDEDLVKCVKLAKKLDMHLLMHVSKTKEEVETEFYNGRKKKRKPMLYLEDLKFFDHDKITLAECNHLMKYEMEVLRRHNVGVAFTAVSNALQGINVARVPLMREIGINVGLAIGSPVKNDKIDILSQMREALALIRSDTEDATSITCYDVVKMATIEGARALHIDDHVGSIEVGKFADLVMLDAQSSRYLGYSMGKDAYQFLVKNARVSDVMQVLVGGKP